MFPHLAMETLLNAPLHACKQDTVNFETVEGFGEKTVVFSTDDAFMDMTHSHSINFATYADISLHNCDALPTGREKTVVFAADDASMDLTLNHTINTANKDLSVEKRNVSSSVPSVDPGFENFLASLFKPGGPHSSSTAETSSSLAHIKTQKTERVDKENWLPTSVSAAMDKSVGEFRKTGQSSHGSALCPEEDVSMNLTEVHTGRILGVNEDENPFHFLFPTQDMYAQADKRLSQTAEMGKSKSDHKAAATTENRVQKVNIEYRSGPVKDAASLKNPSQNASHPRRKVNFDARDERTEKTIMFSADDEFMDMTQSHTVNIARGPLAPQQESAGGLDLGFKNFLTGLSKPTGPGVKPVIERMLPSAAASSKETITTSSSSSQLKTSKADPGKDNRSPNTSRRFGQSSTAGGICPEVDVGMDLTEAQTGRIIGIAGSDDPFQFLFHTQDLYPHGGGLNKTEKTSGQKNSEALGSSNRTGMGSSLKPSLKTKLQSHQDNFDPEDDQREKTVRFSADDACMDVTRSYTVNIGNDLKLLSCRDKTMRFNVDDAGMDMTQCLTVNIANNLGSESILPVWEQESETRGPTPRGRSSSAQGLAPEFKSMPTSGPGVDPAIAIKKPTAVPSSDVRDSSGVGSVCPKDDVSMDMEMTEAQTGRILGITHADDSLQCLFPTPDLYPHSGGLNKAYTTSGQKNSEALGSSNRTGMGSSLKPSLKTKLQSHQDHFDPEDDHREKTVRFSADDACMDVTRSYTVNIGNDLKLLSCTDKTMRFNVDDAGMDMTQCLTVNIANNLGSESILPVWEQESETRGPTPRGRSSSAQGLAPEFKSLLTSNSGGLRCQDPEIARKTLTAAPSSDVRDSSGVGSICPEDDVSMDMEMTEAQTGRILGITHADDSLQFPTQDLYPHSGSLKRAEMASLLPSSEVSGSSDCKGMDKSFQTSLNTAMEKQQVKFDAEVDCREETVKLSTDDAATNVTAGFTVNVASKSVSASFLPHQESNIVPTQRDAGFPFTVKKGERSRSLSARSLDTGFKTSLSRKSCPWANPMITKAVAAAAAAAAAQCPLEGVGAKGHREQLRAQRPDVDTEDAAPGFVPTAIEKSQNKTMTEINMSMDMTEAQTDHIFGQTYTDELPQCFPPTHDSDPEFDLSNRTEATSQRSDEAPGPSNQVANFPGYVDSDEIVTGKEPEPSNEPKMESPRSTVDQDPETLGSRKLRRLSLADLQSKARRLSRLINTAPDTLAMESCAPPLAQLEDDDDLDQTSKDKNKSPEPELATGSENTRDDTQARCLARGGEASAATTPFKLKTKQLMSRLSVGSFKPKLPQRNKPNQPKTGNCAGEHTRTMTVNVTNQLSNFDDDVSDIYDEELGSLEEETETLDAKSPRRVTEKVSRAPEADEPLEEEELEEDLIGAVHGRKRPLPEDENNTEDEKRMRAERSTDVVEMSHFVECDITAAPTVTAHASDCSSSIHTASVRCEATFESTFKQSLFESQLEDYASDVQKKLDDGTITVLEFFNLFNIDFVIHNPRQSVLPGRRLSDTDCTTMDVLKDRHISRPKQTVYETDVLNLTEKVEGLKVRMQDLDKPLKMVNKPLWEEIRNCSERELKSFGASLKERNNFFRKTSKAQSHEMKEVLYSNIVQANLEEQQKLRGTIEEADEMIKSLDDCICELEAELAAVGEKGFLDKPSLKSRQEEMKNVTEALADTERQTIEVELQKKHNSSKLNRLKAETRNLESHVTVLQMVNEWRFGEQSDSCTVYTFLHDTLHLQLVYEKSKGTDADTQSERKISHISFKLQLDGEKKKTHNTS
uniref:Knl1 C-terminal RWD domain-containing protein n=2 Tax=Scophthalmus maximus TaxID=52904 RepID=A0A8D3EE82_SCOMX